MSSKFNPYYYTGYEVDDEPSEDEQQNSSENNSDNEIEKDFAVYQKPMPKSKVLIADFENDMEANLSGIISKLGKEEQEKVVRSGVKEEEGEEESDTDSEVEEATGQRATKKRQHLTNDELLYDPTMDDADEKWMNEQRATYKSFNKEQETTTTAATSSSSKPTDLKHTQKPPDSDAVLNCPCCMTVLCADCQRHESFRNQYRAMFVFNCKTDETELLKYPKEAATKKRKSKKATAAANDEYDEYKAVHCTKCNTQVGLFEHKEDLYHFFNVLASH